MEVDIAEQTTGNYMKKYAFIYFFFVIYLGSLFSEMGERSS